MTFTSDKKITYLKQIIDYYDAINDNQNAVKYLKIGVELFNSRKFMVKLAKFYQANENYELMIKYYSMTKYLKKKHKRYGIN